MTNTLMAWNEQLEFSQ